MKTKEEIEKLVFELYKNSTLLDDFLVDSTPSVDTEKVSKEVLMLMAIAYTQCQKDNADKKYTEEELIEFIWAYKNAVNKDEFINTDKWIENNIESLNKQD